MQLTLQNDAQTIRTFIQWLQNRSVTYNQQMSAANLTAAGITGSDQNSVNALSADIARLLAYMTGTPQTVAADMRVDVVNILGVL